MVSLTKVNFAEILPPARAENKSSTFGMGYMSKVEIGLTICLKSPQMHIPVLLLK